MKKFIILFSVLFLAACSSTNYEDRDPLRGYNRAMTAFNTGFETVVLKPVTKGYRFVTPSKFRTMVTNFFRNLSQPIFMANNLLQLDFKGAADNLKAFTSNTLVGGFGLFDVYRYEGYDYQKEDFGQTLAKWGLGTGPHLVLPIFGPSNIRDTAGLITDSFVVDPVNRYSKNTGKKDYMIGKAVGTGITTYDENMETLDNLRENSVDYYVSLKSVYEQRRLKEIADGAHDPYEDFDFDDFEDYE